MSIAKNLRANFYAPRTTAQHVDELRCHGAGAGGVGVGVKSANVLSCLRVWLVNPRAKPCTPNPTNQLGTLHFLCRAWRRRWQQLAGHAGRPDQSPIPSLPSSASPLGADTYFITAKFVFECKTKRDETRRHKA